MQTASVVGGCILLHWGLMREGWLWNVGFWDPAWMWAWGIGHTPAWGSVPEPSQPGQGPQSHMSPLGLRCSFCAELPDGETSVGKLLLGPGDSLLRLWGWVTWALRLSQPQAWSLIS